MAAGTHDTRRLIIAMAIKTDNAKSFLLTMSDMASREKVWPQLIQLYSKGLTSLGVNRRK